MVALEKMIRELQLVSSPQFAQALARKLAAESMKQVADCFRYERNPYGEPWPAIKRPGKILQDTGRLRASWAPVVVGPADFRLASNVVYANTHQFGRGPIKPRHMVPVESRGLGPIWTDAYRRVAERHMRDIMRSADRG